MKKTKKVRLDFDVFPDSFERLDNLRRALGVRKESEVLNHALALLNWAVQGRKTGRKIGSIDEQAGRFEEVNLPPAAV